MWGEKKSMGFTNNHTLISRAAKIVGDLYFSGDLQIEGKVCGNVIAEGDKDAKLVVAETGVVEGDIHAPAVVINGKVVGDIHSTKHIELAAKAVVEGSVHYQLIEMVKGSQINGNLIAQHPAETAKGDNSGKDGQGSVATLIKTSAKP